MIDINVSRWKSNAYNVCIKYQWFIDEYCDVYYSISNELIDIICLWRLLVDVYGFMDLTVRMQHNSGPYKDYHLGSANVSVSSSLVMRHSTWYLHLWSQFVREAFLLVSNFGTS